MSEHSATATVETLTAEIRVLMVGNRQITQSVAKQLDVVELHEMRIFGRIRLGAEQHVIGAHQATGVLVTSPLELGLGIRCFVDLSKVDPDDWPTFCPRPGLNRDGYLNLTFQGQPVFISRDEVGLIHPIEFDKDQVPKSDDHQERNRLLAESRALQAEAMRCRDECSYWNPNGARDEIARQVANHLAEYERNKNAFELAKRAELIVLAGLR